MGVAYYSICALYIRVRNHVKNIKLPNKTNAHMKKTLTFLLLAALLLLVGCKYDDGPLVSIRSKEARVVNTWVPEKATINGVDGLKTDGNGVSYIDGDSTGYYLALKEVTFLGEGGCFLVYKTSQDNNYTGTWELYNDKQQIAIRLSPPVFGMPYVSMDWEILRLNENHLRVTYIWERNLFLVDFVSKK